MFPFRTPAKYIIMFILLSTCSCKFLFASCLRPMEMERKYNQENFAIAVAS